MLRPLSGRILVLRKPLEITTKSGIIVASEASRVNVPPLFECTVIAKALDADIDIKEGDVIFVEPHGLSPYMDDLYITRPENVVGVDK